MPECPYPLLGRDLLQKLQATISFKEGHTELTLGATPSAIMLTCPLSEEYLLLEEPVFNPSLNASLLKELQCRIPLVWAETNPPGLAAHQSRVFG